MTQDQETAHLARQAAALKPCPFCGSAHVIRDPSADCTATPCVMCIKCGAHVIHQAQDDADELWNRRADLARPPQAGDERVARLVETARDVIEGWEWWTADEYDRDRGVVSDGIHDLRAALAAMDTPKGGGAAWQPIETAPNNQQIVVAYDDGSIEMISAEDNDYEWEKYTGPRDYCTAPTHWQPPPAPPAAMKDGG